MKCRQVEEQLVGYLQETLDTNARREVESHLRTCSACQAESERTRALWGILGDLGPPKTDVQAGWDRLRQRVAREEHETRSRPAREWWARFLGPAGAMAAGALALALYVGGVFDSAPDTSGTSSPFAVADGTEPSSGAASDGLTVARNLERVLPGELPAPSEQSGQPAISDDRVAILEKLEILENYELFENLDLFMEEGAVEALVEMDEDELDRLIGEVEG